MAHFQLGHNNLLAGGTRLFVSGNSGPERIVIQRTKKVTLELAGLGSAALKPTIVATSLGVVSITDLKGSGTKRSFTLTAVGTGFTGLVAKDAGGNSLGTNPLFIIHTGDFQKHPGMEHDLIADVFRSADAAKMHLLTRMLFNDRENIFNEFSAQNQKRFCNSPPKAGCLPCGSVAKAGGRTVFQLGPKYNGTNYDYNDYHKPIATGARADPQREDILYDPAKLSRGCAALKNRLSKGMASVVGLVYGINSRIVYKNGTINVNGSGGHSVLVVGCDLKAEKFLYIDTFEEGSRLKYGGGFPGRDLFMDCDYLGMFALTDDAARGIKVLRSTTAGKSPTFQGSSFLEVVSGPLN